jgi:hypothetical protein
LISAKVAGCQFSIIVTERRFRRSSGSFRSKSVSAYQEQAATKTAYRFLSNERAIEEPVICVARGSDSHPYAIELCWCFTRDEIHGANALKRKINPTRVPVEQEESCRWLENGSQATTLLAGQGASFTG